VTVSGSQTIWVAPLSTAWFVTSARALAMPADANIPYHPDVPEIVPRNLQFSTPLSSDSTTTVEVDVGGREVMQLEARTTIAAKDRGLLMARILPNSAMRWSDVMS